MRRLIAFGGAVSSLACASMQSPPGGPRRTEPPILVAVTPESGAVNVTDRAAVFSFDVIIDDRAGRDGKLENSFLVSPADGGAVVTWKRDRVEVRPRRGFRPGTAYSVTMLPGVSDLNRNAMKETRVITFSTGATIPLYAIHGRVFDWLAERVAVGARIDVIRLPDSLPYVAITDSSGQFRVGPLDTGAYAVRVLVDGNRNGLRDAAEGWDSTSVVVQNESPFVELRAVQRDSLPPRILTVNPLDSLRLTLAFDRLLDPTMALTPAMFRVQRADSTLLSIRRVHTQAQFQRLRLAEDSAVAAARRDSIAKADTARPPTATTSPATAPGVTAAPAAPAAPTARESEVRAVPKPSVPPPAREIVIELDPATPLAPLASYRVLTTGIRGLTGLAQASDRAFTVPRRDTTTATPVRP